MSNVRIRPRNIEIDRTLWSTPQRLFEVCNNRFGFTIDVCAQRETAKLHKFYSPTDDGLLRSWAGERAWMNPPYGAEKPRWLQKAATETRGDCELVVGLVPPGTDAQAWHAWVLRFACRVICLLGRVNFEPPHGVVVENGNADPSVLVVWQRGLSGPPMLEGWDWRRKHILL